MGIYPGEDKKTGIESPFLMQTLMTPGIRSNSVATLVVSTMAICTSPLIYAAQPHYVLKTRNMNPFDIMYYAGGPQSVDVLAQGQFATSLSLSTSNNSITSSSHGEIITIDGESYVTDIELRYGLMNNLDIGARVPLIYHTPGYFDNFIESWHDLFGFSNSRRDTFPSNQLKYEYVDNGVTLVSLTQKESGIGDVTINAKYHLPGSDSDTLSAAVVAGFKLPTGDAGKLTGSDAVDANVSVHLSELRWLSSINTRFYGGAGISFLGDGKVLAERQNNTHYSIYLGAAWSIKPHLNAIAQLDYQSAFYRSELDQLGKNSTQLYIGGSYLADSSLQYDFGLGENLYTDGTPDFLLYFSVTIPH